MIVKSLSRHSGSTSQLLRYILRYVLEKEEKTVKEKQPKERPFIIKHNLRSRSINGYVKEFEKLEGLRQYKRSNSVSVYHHILSFSSKDKEYITDALLKDIASKFIELRGQDNLYIGTKHTDKEHVHLHLAMSATDVVGRSVRISKAEFQQLKQEFDAYQKEHYPELIHSLPAHGAKSKTEIRHSIAETVQSHRTSEKGSLLQTLAASFSKSHSVDEFLQELSAQGYTPYYRSGNLTGLTTEGGRKYRLAPLGYNAEKLQALNLNQEEAKQLAELRELRNQTKDKTNTRTSENDTQILPEEADNRVLEEIQSIRDSTSESQSKSETEREDNQPTQEEDRTEDNSRDTIDEDSRER